MATRSLIGVGTPTDFTATYVHWDGSPSGVGKLLYKMLRLHEAPYMDHLLKHQEGGLSFLPESMEDEHTLCYCHTFTDHARTCTLAWQDLGKPGERSLPRDTCTDECVQRRLRGNSMDPKSTANVSYGYIVGEDRKLRILECFSSGDVQVLAEIDLNADSEPFWQMASGEV